MRKLTPEEIEAVSGGLYQGQTLQEWLQEIKFLQKTQQPRVPDSLYSAANGDYSSVAGYR